MGGRARRGAGEGRKAHVDVSAIYTKGLVSGTHCTPVVELSRLWSAVWTWATRRFANSTSCLQAVPVPPQSTSNSSNKNSNNNNNNNY